jgi:hypothetical protein
LLRVLGAHLLGKFLYLRQLGVADAGIPVHVDAPLSESQRQRYRAENADRLPARRLVGFEPASVAIDANELALGDEALADPGIEVREHWAAL